jgi:hypothetical protein
MDMVGKDGKIGKEEEGRRRGNEERDRKGEAATGVYRRGTGNGGWEVVWALVGVGEN